MVDLPDAGLASGDQLSGYEVWAMLARLLVADGFDQALLTMFFSDQLMVYDHQAMSRKMNPLLEAKLPTSRPRLPSLSWTRAT